MPKAIYLKIHTNKRVQSSKGLAGYIMYNKGGYLINIAQRKQRMLQLFCLNAYGNVILNESHKQVLEKWCQEESLKKTIKAKIDELVLESWKSQGTSTTNITGS